MPCWMHTTLTQPRTRISDAKTSVHMQAQAQARLWTIGAVVGWRLHGDGVLERSKGAAQDVSSFSPSFLVPTRSSHMERTPEPDHRDACLTHHDRDQHSITTPLEVVIVRLDWAG